MKKTTVTLLLAGVLTARPPQAEESARAFMEHSEAVTKAKTEVDHDRVELWDTDGSLIQTRQMLYHFKKLPDEEVTLIRFLAPPALKGVGLRIVDKGDSVNDLWLYLPATRRLRRLAGAEKTNWFMGTEFTNEDFEDYQIPLYRFRFLDEVACLGDRRCRKVEAKAEDPRERAITGYGAKIYYIETESLYPVAIDYLDRSGQRVKQYRTGGLHREGRYWRPQWYEMHNLKNDRRTRIVVEQRTLDGPLSDYHVSARYLRSAP